MESNSVIFWSFFIQLNSLDFQPGCCLYQHFLLFYCRIVFHDMNIPQFNQSLFEEHLIISEFELLHIKLL